MPRKVLAFFMFWAVLGCSIDESEEILSTRPQTDALQSVDQTPQLVVPFDECLSVSFDLFAGRKEIAGKVLVENTKDSLTITYKLNEGWYMLAAKVFAGKFEDIPLFGGGNPKVGQFPYKYEFKKPQSEFSLTIALSEISLSAPTCISIAAYAALVTKLPEADDDDDDDDRQTAAVSKNFTSNTSKKYRYEGGWAGDQDFPGNSIARYMNYCLQDCFKIQVLNCQDAFMFGDVSFIDFGLTNTRWGWISEIKTNETIQPKPMYIGAVNNNLAVASHVSDVLVTHNDKKVTVQMQAFPGYSFNQTNVYLSDDPPTQHTPNTYPYRQRNANATSVTYDIEYSGDGQYWLIVNAQVCNER
ncbi:MAG: hypothetical protein RQ735_09555 [Flavobacteriaceae bacterium]|nr:hypothetical protein [Flavobacteriaceae bacterium]